MEITALVIIQLFDIVNMGRETWTALRCDADLVIGCNTLIVNCFYNVSLKKVMTLLGLIYQVEELVIFFETHKRYIFICNASE